MQYRKRLQRLAETINNTNNTLTGVPIVELAGDRRVLIENHRGVIEYGAKQICVKVKCGSLCICGQNMELAKMTGEQLVITGMIESVTIRRRGI